jgi:putative ABC transport system permease protein
LADLNVIQKQVRLPLRVAVGVVMQGIRIRLGRSLVTISGVVLGVAFLMSILAGQLIQAGVAEEEELRSQVGRMSSFLGAETGPMAGRVVGVIQAGELIEVEQRLVRRISRDGGVLRYHAVFGEPPPAVRQVLGEAEFVPLEEMGTEASAVVILGDRSTELDLDWSDTLQDARQPVVAALDPAVGQAVRESVDPTLRERLRFARLDRDLRPEEIAARAAEEKRETFRAGWILTIALLVTVIGIANAMIMSVTERFREIGTMKCLGALSSFVRRLFLIESSLMGFVGGLAGTIFGTLFSAFVYSLTYGFELTLGSVNYPLLLLAMAGSLVAGVSLSILAAIYPANFAARMVPASALRTNI